ncbi:hypothetical protein TASI_1016 [Taylorella asinigenitalis MCE3]|uniref:Uncharacterized protein n=1 Tax=Taylorella asinigenitalis (strain MCE3) TaxID=1008459 RepID=G4QBV9_TAYAM|nr:hypothetical protein TASI_1016 [Taylorella asinigenitalis MCE3]
MGGLYFIKLRISSTSSDISSHKNRRRLRDKLSVEDGWDIATPQKRQERIMEQRTNITVLKVI